MDLIKASLHEHLGTNTYKGPAKRVIETARARLGPGGMFAVTSTADDRCPHGDRRYEKFEDSVKKLGYALIDLNGRGFYLPSYSLICLNSTEAEIKDGSVLVLGLQRDSNVLTAGKNVTHHELFAQLTGVKHSKGYVHTHFPGGSGAFLEKEIEEERGRGCLEGISFVEVRNRSAYLIPGSNKKAYDFYKRISQDYPLIAPVTWTDGHSVRYDFCSLTTELSPLILFESSEEIVDELNLAFRKRAEACIASPNLIKEASLTDKLGGFFAASAHAANLKFLRPLAMKLGIMTEKDW